MLQRSTERLDIDLLVLPDANLILIASVIEPLRGANRISGSELYRWRLLTPDGAPVLTTSNIAVPAQGTFMATTEDAPLFVLASYNWRRSATPALKMQLSQAARYRTVIAGIESGTRLLAEASLLDGLPATVHWEDYEDFALAYPEVRAVKDRFVIDGKRLTTSGSLPTVDLMLEVIRRRQGYSLALEVSRLFRYEQPSFHADEPLSAASAGLRMHDPRVTQAVRLMEEHIEQPLVWHGSPAGWNQRPASAGSLPAEHRRAAACALSGAAPECGAPQGDRDDSIFRRHRRRDRLQLGVGLCEKLPGEFFREPVGHPAPLAPPHHVIGDAGIGWNASRIISASSRTASLER